MRYQCVVSLTLMAAFVSAAQADYPFWNGQETIVEYAKRAGIEPTKTLDLGDDVKLELVLIPAGTFTMGVPEPTPVDIEDYHGKILTGQVGSTLGGGVLAFLLGVVLMRAIRKRQWPQFSLAWLLATAVVAGGGLLAGLHWFYSARAFADAQSEYQAAVTHFRSFDDGEKPGHEVTISAPYYIGKFEVTQEQYQRIIGWNPSKFKGRDLPVENVDWWDTQEFCRRVNSRTARLEVVRLPTEALWERACRAGAKTTCRESDSETDLGRLGWYNKNSNKTTHPVGEKAPNAWGVYDMHGNVQELCVDWYETYRADAVVDPQGMEYGFRVSRGGSWYDGPGFCRSSLRHRYDDRHGYYSSNRGIIGFRVVGLVPRTP